MGTFGDSSPPLISCARAIPPPGSSYFADVAPPPPPPRCFHFSPTPSINLDSIPTHETFYSRNYVCRFQKYVGGIIKVLPDDEIPWPGGIKTRNIQKQEYHSPDLG